MHSSKENSSNDGQAGSAVKPVVCFLGPISSYTHQAALETFPADKFELMPVVTIQDIFDTTQSGGAAYGVVPFENSTNGSVVFTLDHLADRSNSYADLSVCAEIYLDVHHCILGRVPPSQASSTTHSSSQQTQPQTQPQTSTTGTAKDSSSPPASGQCTPTPGHPDPARPRSRPLHPLSHVRRVYSHPQAFGQCTRFLGTYLRGVETIDVSSTSRAAELAREDAGGTSAAISSAVAAGLQGLDVLARDVEDREDNTTRFFVLRRGGADGDGVDVESLLHRERRGETGNNNTTATGSSRPNPNPNPNPTAADYNNNDNDDDDDDEVLARTKSLVSFTVPHHSPGALADVLDCFRRAGLNLTSISSRPSLEAPFTYVFFVEFEGHRSEDPRGRVGGALRGITAVARSWRWLGSWENMRRR